MSRRSTADADFAALHRRTFGRVWTILGRAGITRPAERCELAQDVYLVVHLKLATRDPAVPELAWIGAITWNIARRYRALERTRREQPVDDPEIIEEPIAGGASPEDIVGRRRRYLDIMEGVTFDRRVVFEMCEVEGWSGPEIAGALGVPLGTVNTRLRLAREDVAAAASRLQAREAHQARADGRAAAMPILLPFGAGAWQHLGGLFDDAPPGMEERVWRDVCRALTRAAVLGGAAGGATAGGIAAGFLLGAGTVGAVVLALRLLAPAPPISRAPDVASVALAPSAPVTASAEPGNAAPPAAVVPVATVAVASAPKLGLVGGIDPEEERLVARAQAAFVRGNTAAARAALDEHARRFPPERAKLTAESAHLRAKLEVTASPSATTSSAPPDGGRAPHRLMDVEN